MLCNLGVDVREISDKRTGAVLDSASSAHTEQCCRESRLSEKQRTDLIAAIIALVRVDGMTDDVRKAALTLVGWLARRHGAETPCTRGVYEARKQLMTIQSGHR